MEVGVSHCLSPLCGAFYIQAFFLYEGDLSPIRSSVLPYRPAYGGFAGSLSTRPPKYLCRNFSIASPLLEASSLQVQILPVLCENVVSFTCQHLHRRLQPEQIT